MRSETSDEFEAGHGQSYVHNDDELKEAYKEAMEEGRGDVKEVIIEEFTTFDSEFTLLTVTQKDGPTLFCPPIGHVQKGGDYRESWQPFQISEEALKKAEYIAGEVTKALKDPVSGRRVLPEQAGRGYLLWVELLSLHTYRYGRRSVTPRLSEFELHFHP